MLSLEQIIKEEIAERKRQNRWNPDAFDPSKNRGFGIPAERGPGTWKKNKNGKWSKIDDFKGVRIKRRNAGVGKKQKHNKHYRHHDKSSRKVQKRWYDWKCSQCNIDNTAKNKKCRGCGKHFSAANDKLKKSKKQRHNARHQKRVPNHLKNIRTRSHQQRSKKKSVTFNPNTKEITYPANRNKTNPFSSTNPFGAPSNNPFQKTNISNNSGGVSFFTNNN